MERRIKINENGLVEIPDIYLELDELNRNFIYILGVIDSEYQYYLHDLDSKNIDSLSKKENLCLIEADYFRKLNLILSDLNDKDFESINEVISNLIEDEEISIKTKMFVLKEVYCKFAKKVPFYDANVRTLAPSIISSKFANACMKKTYEDSFYILNEELDDYYDNSLEFVNRISKYPLHYAVDTIEGLIDNGLGNDKMIFVALKELYDRNSYLFKNINTDSNNYQYNKR